MDGEIIYSGMTRRQLDDAYDNRGHAPTFAGCLDRWQSASDRLYETRHGLRDLRYGPRPRQRLDFFFPAPVARRPTVLYIHGGYWQWIDKEQAILRRARAFGRARPQCRAPRVHAEPRSRHGRDRRRGGAGPELARPPAGPLRRRLRPGHRLRQFCRRAPRRNLVGPSLDLRRAADQWRLRPRADPPVLAQRPNRHGCPNRQEAFSAAPSAVPADTDAPGVRRRRAAGIRPPITRLPCGPGRSRPADQTDARAVHGPFLGDGRTGLA